MERISQQIEPDSPRGLGLLALSHPAVVTMTRTMPHQAVEPERPLGSSRLCRLLRALLRRALALPSPRPEPRRGL